MANARQWWITVTIDNNLFPCALIPAHGRSHWTSCATITLQQPRTYLLQPFLFLFLLFQSTKFYFTAIGISETAACNASRSEIYFPYRRADTRSDTHAGHDRPIDTKLIALPERYIILLRMKLTRTRWTDSSASYVYLCSIYQDAVVTTETCVIGFLAALILER